MLPRLRYQAVCIRRLAAHRHKSGRVVTAKDRARLWKLANDNNNHRYDWYQTKTERQIPVVVLSPL